MDVSYIFAGFVVANRDEAVAWYECVFGRPPDMLPNDAEATWRVTDSASVYLLADAAHAGGGIITLVVDDLASVLSQIAGRGILPGGVEEIPGAGRKSVIKDPDGNMLAIVELVRTRDDEIAP